MTTAIQISQSEINTFRTCRRKWWLRYVENLTPRTSTGAQNAGKAGHAGAEFAYRALIKEGHGRNCTRDEMPDDALHLEAVRGVLLYFAAPTGTFEADPIVPDAPALLRPGWAAHLDSVDDALRRTLDDDARGLLAESLGSVSRFVNAFVIPDRWQFQIMEVELSRNVPILDDKGTARSAIRGYSVIDTVQRNLSNNEIVVGEHKFSATDVSNMGSRLDVDPQMPGYVYAIKYETEVARVFNPGGVGRVFLNCTRRTGPGAARVNKIKRSDVCSGESGGCTKSKHAAACTEKLKAIQAQETDGGVNLGRVSDASHDTTRDIYNAALVEQQGRDLGITAEQFERAEQIPQSMDRWASRHEWFYTEQEVNDWRRDQLADARLVRRCHLGILPASRNGYACAPQNALPCSYRTVCVQDNAETRAEFDTREGTRARA